MASSTPRAYEASHKHQAMEQGRIVESTMRVDQLGRIGDHIP